MRFGHWIRNKNENFVLENDKKLSNQLIKSLQIVVYNVKLLILIILTNVLKALVNDTFTKCTLQKQLTNYFVENASRRYSTSFVNR